MLMHVVCGKAAELSTHFGNRLVGATVMTSVLSRWQGGKAIVIEITPDPAAPEIPLQVKHDTTGEEMGIFGDEFLMLEAATLGGSPVSAC
jgi:hypothetical protein